ncbi:MAG: hypothetical protein SF182_11345 [Deltaproteobacteria bacterium]|nr:hypothetical protein [Deltaproteobacteria bacterium]
MSGGSSRETRRIGAGLFATTLATLLLENLDARLLSVLTWYHLSFFAISLAMLGMAAGAVLVFVAGERWTGAAARLALARCSVALAVAIPLCHVAVVWIGFPAVLVSWLTWGAHLLAVSTLLAIPFVLSGVTVTLALTRSGGAIGGLYAADLFGAALGCLAVVPLLNHLDMVGAGLATGGIAAIAAVAFAPAAGRRVWWPAGLALLLLALGALNDPPRRGLGLRTAKGLPVPQTGIALSASNVHAHVLMLDPAKRPIFYWGRGAAAPVAQRRSAPMIIDGSAGTVMTEWNGDPAELAWTRADVTYLPYHIRRGGEVAVIGVGGGRDMLAALDAGSRSVTGIEVNGILVDLLRRRERDFAGIMTRPEATLVHDEARAYLSRQAGRFDVIQMSLVDTWASTAAGAFSLSENGLYTVEGWRHFLHALKPTGVLSVSRWFSPTSVSETNRLLALAVAALLDAGSADPAAHLVLMSRANVATILVSPTALSTADQATLQAVAATQQFTVLAAPWQVPADARMAAIVASRDAAGLAAAVRDPLYDYGAPTDDRPFFFNMLKPAGFLAGASARGEGVVTGNLLATTTLVGLLGVASVLVLLIVLAPLALVGRPDLRGAPRRAAFAYFALIGVGFMCVQIGLVQRFSVYLGHPVYTLAVILFTMIAAAGLGSWWSDRLDPRGGLARRIPLLIAAAIVGLALLVPRLVAVSAGAGLLAKIALVVACTAPVALLLGTCFPLGLRLVRRIALRADAWMWGVNGATGVLGSIIAVALSLWLGISATLLVAAVLYAGLVLPLAVLRGAAPADGAEA